MSEHYRGYSSICSYLKIRGEESSFREFVKLYQEMILESPPDSDNWVGLEVSWKTRFLNAAKETIPEHHKKLCEKVKSEVSNKNLMTYWQDILTEKQHPSTSSNLSHIQKDDLLTSVSETLNIFKKVQFPTYYNKLKEIWYPIIILKLDDEKKHLSQKAHNYLSLFDTILKAKDDKYEELKKAEEEGEIDESEEEEEIHESKEGKENIESKDIFVAEMEKKFHSLNDVATKFRYLSNTLPIPVIEYDQSQNIDIHIIKSISSHIDSYSKMNDLQDTDYRADGVAELFKRPNQIPIRHFHPKQIHDKNKASVMRGDQLDIGQIIYIGPKLYLFLPFTVPSIIIPTSTANLSYTSQLIQTLLWNKYITGASPGQTRTVVFEEFLPKISRDDTKRKRGRPQGKEKRKVNE
ncbi:hypothetical protein C1646_767957 [Rhizophagus diaphanus]|nr:hypothetical protein C1646_767957 [Rhizophagus diaphanus] [Rhizophagus sp. MUCL 43196]